MSAKAPRGVFRTTRGWLLPPLGEGDSGDGASAAPCGVFCRVACIVDMVMRGYVASSAMMPPAQRLRASECTFVSWRTTQHEHRAAASAVQPRPTCCSRHPLNHRIRRHAGVCMQPLNCSLSSAPHCCQEYSAGGLPRGSVGISTSLRLATSALVGLSRNCDCYASHEVLKLSKVCATSAVHLANHACETRSPAGNLQCIVCDRVVEGGCHRGKRPASQLGRAVDIQL